MSKLDKTKFLEAKAKGANNTTAALEAGATTKTAAYKAGYRLSKELNIQKRIDKAIKDNGIDLKYLISVYAFAAKATKTTLIRETGEIVDSGIPDHQVRMKAADKLLNLSGIEHRLNDKNRGSQNNIIEDKPNWAVDLLDSENLKQVTLTKQND